jgi:3-hydroxybutyryl-CoA dehydrogenase
MTMRVAVVGAGLMGSGLALVFAAGGHAIRVTDTLPQTLHSLHERLDGMLKSLGRGDDLLARIETVPRLAEAVAGADLVIEAAPEKRALKQALFEEIEASAPPDAILASNTSVIPIGEVMARVQRKGRALGTHWWNPPYLVPLVEVVQAEQTSVSTVTAMMAILEDLGKLPVHIKKDVPGFVGNRLQHALWREAISLVEKGVCDAETIDVVVKNSFGARLAVLGPMENADMVGTDLTLDIHRQVLAHLEDSPMPSPMLQELVAAGKLGFKSKQGFRTWTDEEIAALRMAVAVHLRKAFK